MNFALRQSLIFFITGIIILMIAIVVFYKLNYDSVLNHQLEDSKFIAENISKDIDQHIIEKVKKTKTIIVAPVITSALFKSNNHYQSLSKKKRDEEILQKNNKWKTIKDQNNSFILDYTNNEISKYLKILQHSIKGEYGEIFLTNKYGALVASTAKLTTFAHSHKYWWQGAYNNGNGAVFLDDRGYDDSVGGYVLGIVIPIKKDNEIIGMLKANLNILGAINTIIINSQMKNHEKLKLIRSGGLIVFEEGFAPLSKRISADLQKKIQTKSNECFVYKSKEDKFIIGVSEIKISSEMEGYNFGGSFESIDHKKGNTGESWIILDLNHFSNVVEQTTEIVSGLWFIGILLTIVFAFTSLIIGQRTAKPLKEFIIQTKRIIKGDYNSEIITNRKDEIGELAISFNQMTNHLKESTTSIASLNAANQQLVASKQQIKKNLKEKTVLIQEIYHRTKNNMAVVIAMLSMESRRSKNDYVKSTFREINNKIQTMALVHQKLYKAKDLSNINLKNYIEDLANLIMQSYGVLSKSIKIKFDLQDTKVLIDSAVPLGLIMNELVSNIFKHAFPNQREGEMLIRLFNEKDKTINLELIDNGIGFPQNFDPRKDGSMGLTSVFSIVEKQLQGKILVKSENGVRWHIRIRNDRNKERV